MYPTNLYVNESFNATYIISNQSSTDVVELESIMDSSDAFVFSGNKQLSLRFLPLQTIRISILYWPLLSGLVKLPHFHLINKRASGDSSMGKDIAGTDDPITVFVRPQNGKLIE